MLKLGELEIELYPVSIVYSDESRGILARIRNKKGTSWIKINGKELKIAPGLTHYLVKTYDGLITVEGEEGKLEARLDLPKPRIFKIYIVPTVHTDIGYTDLQDRVAEVHRENIRRALKMALKGRSKFVVEVLWQMWQASDLLDGILELNRRGIIGIQALPLNILTGLCSHEEIVRLFYPLRDLRSRGAKIYVAAINDIPSAVWVLPSILAACGIKYYIQAINPDRGPICFVNRELAPPMIWVGPDGSEVLAWFSGCYKGPMPGFHGYHQGRWAGLLEDPDRAETGVALYLWYYESRGYPFEKILMYGVFGDNEAISERYVDVIEELRRRWRIPEILIATSDEFFEELKREIASKGSQLQRWSGSFGSYWEDGAASSARELAMARLAKKLLFLAEASYAFDSIAGKPYPHEEISEAWRNLILFDEHTWGAWNSVSEPHNPEVIAQWEVKAGYAARALEIASRLARGEYISNPYPYEVEDLVGNSYVRLHPTSSALIDWKPLWSSTPRRVLETKFYEIEIDGGSIVGIYDKDAGKQILSDSWGFGEVVQVMGGGGSRIERTILSYTYDREPAEPVLRINREIRSRLSSFAENDDMIVVRMIGKAGDISFERILRVSKRHKEIMLELVMEKPDRYEKEGIYVAFPFTPPNKILIEEPGAFTDYTKDYASGACREWFSTNGIVILDGSPNISLYTEDAPLITINDIFRGLWRASPEPPNGTIFSYIMNNYWHTNYKASQGGVFRFSYRVTSADKIKPSSAIRFFSKPLKGRRVKGDLSIDPPEVAVTTIKKWDLGNGILIRFLEVDGENKTFRIRSSLLKGTKVIAASLLEEPQEVLGRFDGEIELKLKPRSYTTIIFEKPI